MFLKKKKKSSVTLHYAENQCFHQWKICGLNLWSKKGTEGPGWHVVTSVVILFYFFYSNTYCFNNYFNSWVLLFSNYTVITLHWVKSFQLNLHCCCYGYLYWKYGQLNMYSYACISHIINLLQLTCYTQVVTDIKNQLHIL